MKLLFVSMHYRPEPCDTRTSQLARGMAARGHKATALTSFPNYPHGRVYPGYKQRLWKKDRIDGVDVIRVPMFVDHSLSKFRRGFSYLSFGVSAALLGGVLAGRPDLVWIHHPPLTSGIAGYLIAASRRIPFVYEIHDLWPETLLSTGVLGEGRIARMIRKISQALYRRAAAIIVPSEGMKECLLAQGVPADKISVIPQWADEATFKQVPRDLDFGEKHGLTGKFNVVFAGNIGIAQSLDTMLEAASRLQARTDLQFVVIGAGVDLDRLRKRAKKMRLKNLRFLGQFPPEEIPSFLAWADGLLLHLHNDPLFSITVPAKLQVYLSAGKPILCGVGGEASRIVAESKAGLVFPPEDSKSMTEAIVSLQSLSSNARDHMGRSARAAYQCSFSESALLGRYEEVFSDLTERRNLHRERDSLLGRMRALLASVWRRPTASTDCERQSGRAVANLLQETSSECQANRPGGVLAPNVAKEEGSMATALGGQVE